MRSLDSIYTSIKPKAIPTPPAAMAIYVLKPITTSMVALKQPYKTI